MKRAIVIMLLAAAPALAFDAAPLVQWITGATFTPLTLGPVAWYKGDGNALDNSGNGYNGTWSGTEGYTNGVNAQAFHFNGSSWVDTGQTNIANGLFAAPNRQWSVGVWAKIAFNVSGSIIARCSANGPTRTFQLFFMRSGDQQATPTIFLRGAATSTALNLDDGMWHHHAITWDGNVARYYVDGVFSRTLNTGPSAAEETGQRIIIGARTNGEGLRTTGSIDDVFMEDRALTPAEILRLYQWRQ